MHIQGLIQFNADNLGQLLSNAETSKYKTVVYTCLNILTYFTFTISKNFTCLNTQQLSIKYKMCFIITLAQTYKLIHQMETKIHILINWSYIKSVDNRRIAHVFLPIKMHSQSVKTLVTIATYKEIVNNRLIYNLI